MSSIRHALLACALVAAPASIAAQTGGPLVVGAPSAGPVLSEGTEIPMVTLTELTSRKTKVGQRFDLEVAEDVLLEGQVVIPRGSRAVGEVTRVVKKGMWGKSGKLDTQLLYVRVGNQQVRVNGKVGDRGKSGTAGVVGAVLVAPIVGFFVTGTSAVLPPRTVATGYLDADLPVQFAGVVSPAPLIVPATAPIAPPPSTELAPVIAAAAAAPASAPLNPAQAKAEAAAAPLPLKAD